VCEARSSAGSVMPVLGTDYPSPTLSVRVRGRFAIFALKRSSGASGRLMGKFVGKLFWNLR
jgi:hypothetical protein